jgi:hypothetical protein
VAFRDGTRLLEQAMQAPPAHTARSWPTPGQGATTFRPHHQTSACVQPASTASLSTDHGAQPLATDAQIDCTEMEDPFHEIIAGGGAALVDDVQRNAAFGRLARDHPDTASFLRRADDGRALFGCLLKPGKPALRRD